MLRVTHFASSARETGASLQNPETCAYVQYPLCISLMETGRVDVKPLITHRFGWSESEVKAGFDCAVRSAETKAIKVMFRLP